MRVCEAPTPVTNPLVETVATAVAEVVQTTVCPVTAVPAASRGVATNCNVLLGAIVAVAGVTSTDATAPELVPSFQCGSRSLPASVVNRVKPLPSTSIL